MNRKFAGVVWRHLDLVDVPRASRAPVIAFDPYRRSDETFIRSLILPAYPDAVPLQLPFAGHHIARAMQESNQLGHFVSSIVDHGTVPEIRLVEDGGRVWHCERGYHFLETGHLDVAEQEFRKSLAIRTKMRALVGLITLLLKKGNRIDLVQTIAHLTQEETRDMLPEDLKDSIRKVIGL